MSRIAVKNNSYPAAQVPCVEREFEFLLGAQLSP